MKNIMKHCLLASAIALSAATQAFTPPYDVAAKNYLTWAGQQENDQGLSCNAVLISETHMLTAAHCLDDEDEVRALSIRFSNFHHPLSIPVKRYLTHPWYRTGDLVRSGKYDLAIIELNSPVHVPVPRIDYSYDCSQFFFGEEKLKGAAFNPDDKDTLRIVNLFRRGSCLSQFNTAIYFGQGETDDSGSALFYERNNGTGTTQHLIGILNMIDDITIYWTSLRVNRDFLQQFLSFSEDDDGTVITETLYPDAWKEPLEPTEQPEPATDSAKTSSITGLLVPAVLLAAVGYMM